MYWWDSRGGIGPINSQFAQKVSLPIPGKNFVVSLLANKYFHYGRKLNRWGNYLLYRVCFHVE